jgi:hypothetical protein
VLRLPHSAPLSSDAGAREGITTDSSDSTTLWIGSKRSDVGKEFIGTESTDISLDLHVGAYIRPPPAAVEQCLSGALGDRRRLVMAAHKRDQRVDSLGRMRPGSFSNRFNDFRASAGVPRLPFAEASSRPALRHVLPAFLPALREFQSLS